MGHGHGHGGSASATAGQRHRGRLVAALAIALGVMTVEVVVGLVTGSTALLADAGHMLTDAAGLAIALAATWIAARPASARWTFGFQRAEILAALVNGVVLSVVGVLALITGLTRLGTPHPVEPLPVLLAGALGLVANVIGLRLLHAGSRESLNVRGAYLEVLGDLLGSIAVVISAVVIAVTGWERADAVATLAIGLLILPRAASLLAQVARVLLEGAPEELAVASVRDHLESAPGVVAVHDLHAWTITSGVPVLSAHIVVDDDAVTPEGMCAVLDSFRACLAEHFDLEHSTLQIEPASHHREHPEPAAHA